MKKILFILMSVACVCDSYATLIRIGRDMTGSSTVVGSMFPRHNNNSKPVKNNNGQQGQETPHTSYPRSDIARNDHTRYDDNNSLYQETSQQDRHDINDAYLEYANASNDDRDFTDEDTRVNQNDNDAGVEENLESSQCTENSSHDNDEHIYYNQGCDCDEHHEMPHVHDHEQSFISTRATFSALAGGIVTIGAAVGVYCWLCPEDVAQHCSQLYSYCAGIGGSLYRALWGASTYTAYTPAHERVADVVNNNALSPNYADVALKPHAPCHETPVQYDNVLDALCYLQG